MTKQPRRIGLWGFGGLSPLEVVRRMWRGYRDYQVAALAAQFAFYAMLALAPLLMLLIAAAVRLPMRGTLRVLRRGLGEALPETSFELLQTQMQELLQETSSTMLVACATVLLFSGWRLFNGLGHGLNLVNGVKGAHTLRTGSVSLALTLAVVPMMLLALVLAVGGPMLTRSLLNYFEVSVPRRQLMHSLRGGIVVVCLLLSTSAIYCYLPAVRLRWHWMSPGSALAVAGWMGASWAFRLYVEQFGRYNETYGTLGGVMVLMLWLYLVGMLLLLGGLLNGMIYRAEAERGG